MSNTFKQEEHKKYKSRNYRKSFVLSGEKWSTKSQGGIGNKRGWKNGMPKWFYKLKKERLKNEEI